MENVEVRFTATAAGVQTTTNGVAESVGGVAAEAKVVTGAFDGLMAKALSMFAAMKAGFTETRSEMAATSVAAGGIGHGLASSLEQIEGIHRKVGQLAALFAEAFAVREVLEFASAHAEAAEKIEQESQKLGISTDSVQQWNVVAEQSGRSAEQFQTLVTRLERSMVTAVDPTTKQAGALKMLGINAQDAQDPNKLLLEIADKFHDMPDGPEKVAIAMTLMGRAGADSIPILNEGAAAIEAMRQKGIDYGATLSEDMLARQEAVNQSLKDSKLAAEGLGNVIADAAAPAIEGLSSGFNELVVAMVQSYRSGGEVKQVLDFIIESVKFLIGMVVMLGSAFVATFNLISAAVYYFQGVVEVVWAYLKEQVNILAIEFETLGQVIVDALTGQWGEIIASVHAGVNGVTAEVQRATNEIARIKTQAFDPGNASASQAFSGMNATGDWFRRFMSSNSVGAASIMAGQLGRRSGGGGGDLEAIKGAPHEKKGKDDQVAQWQEQLHAQEIASGEYFKDQTAAELAFWQSKLALTTAGSKDWLAVQDKIFSASKKLAQEAYQAQIAGLDYQIQSAKNNFAEQERLEQTKVDLVRKTYGDQSSQYQAALREQERMLQQHEAETARIQEAAIVARLALVRDSLKADEQVQASHFAAMSASIQAAENDGLISRRQAAAARITLLNQEYAAKVAEEEAEYQATIRSLQDQLAVRNLEPKEREKINADIERQNAEHLNRMRVQEAQYDTQKQAATQAAADAYYRTWMDRLTPLTQALTGMVNSFLTSATTLRQAVLAVGSQLLQAANTWVMQQVQQHVAGEAAKTGSTAAGAAARLAAESAANTTGMAMNAASATSEITTHAAVAAAGALRAVSHIPIIGPFIAPAIAAGILALAMGFISRIASAEGGWGQVPTDGMMTELHKDEMVLPSSIASPLRQALSLGQWGLGATGLAAASQGAAGSTQGGMTTQTREGDVHLHLQAMDGKSARRFFFDNAGHLADALRLAMRNNE